VVIFTSGHSEEATSVGGLISFQLIAPCRLLAQSRTSPWPQPMSDAEGEADMEPIDARGLFLTQMRQCVQRKSADRLTISYQRLMIHFAPTNICQTAAVATVSTMMAATKAIERRAPSSSR
jgi:hypothetical protein